MLGASRVIIGAPIPSLGFATMLFENDVKEHLALAYVYAVASRADCSTEFVRVDRDSVDLLLHHRDESVGEDEVMTGALGVQVKAHALDHEPGPIRYYLNSEKNFEDLSRKNHLYPRILVVVFLPKDETTWVGLSEDELILRRCGYWTSLAGASSRSITFPRTNAFTPEALLALMERARKREPLT